MVILWIQPKTCSSCILDWMLHQFVIGLQKDWTKTCSSCILDWMLHQYLLLGYKKTNLKHAAVAFLIECFINICYWATERLPVCWVGIFLVLLFLRHRGPRFLRSRVRTASPYDLIWHAKCRWYWEPTLYIIPTRQFYLPLHVQYMHLGFIEPPSAQTCKTLTFTMTYFLSQNVLFSWIQMYQYNCII